MFSDYQSRQFYGLTEAQGTLVELRKLGSTSSGISSFAEDLAGNLYALFVDGGEIQRLDLGEVAKPLPVAINQKHPNAKRVFSQLILTQSLSDNLSFKVSAEGKHHFSIYSLAGELIGKTKGTGPGEYSVQAPKILKGAYLIQWNRDGHLFSKRVQFQ